MANSYNTYIGNGTQTAFLVTFEQRDFTAIQVYLNSELQTGGYTYNSVTKQIIFMTAPASGVNIRLQRYTSQTLINKFGSDAAFTGQNIDENFEQVLFKAEETQEAWLSPLDRTLRVPNSELSINTLPTVANRKGKALAFDSVNGQPVMIPLVDIEDSALAIALAMSDGGKWIGTKAGGTFLDRQDTVCISEFLNNTIYASVASAVQACFDWAATNNAVVDARGAEIALDGNVTMTNIEVVGGTWSGTSDIFIVNSLFHGFLVKSPRLRPWGGAVRIKNGEFDGKPSSSKVASIVMQALPATATIECDGLTFRNGLFGILQQGTGEVVTSGVYRNIAMYNMVGDGIELNVVNRHYEDGCVIENIYLENIDGTDAPIALSNWGIGIGVAGQGPYGWDATEDQYAKNVTVRNVLAKGVRQVVHFEVTRDSTVSNIHCDPDQNVSNGTGLTLAGVIAYGCKRMVIDGVYGEPVVTGSTDPHSVRLVMLEWGTNAGTGASNPCFDMVVRNVVTRTGRVYAGIGSNDTYTNDFSLENVHCYTLSLFGVATRANLTNVTGVVLDCVGDDSAGGTPSDGVYPRGKTVLNLTNVQFFDPNNHGNQVWSRCRFSDIFASNSNIRTVPYTNIAGNVGPIMSPVGRIVSIDNTPALSTGAEFPTGKEFDVGTMILKTDGSGTFFLVTGYGAYIPVDGANFQIRAAAAGQTYVEQNLVPNGTETNASWLYHRGLAAGTRINIPGAGAGGTTLTTTIIRAPYQVDNNIGNPVRIDISPPIATAVGAGTQLAATYPVTFI